jgi:hypothetical protein
MLLLAALALAPPTVSLRLTAPVAKVAGELARQSGQRIEISASVPNDTLIVDLRDADFTESLRRVAWAVHAEVRTEPGGFRLVAQDPLPARKAFRQWLLDRNKRLVEKLSEDVLKEPDWNAATEDHRRATEIERQAEDTWTPARRQEHRRLRAQVPSLARRTLVRLIAAFPPERLIAPNNPDEVQFYGTSPVGLQAPLPAQAPEILKRFQEEQVRLTGQRLPFGKVILALKGFGGPFPSLASIEFCGADGTLLAWDSMTLPSVDPRPSVVEEVRAADAIELSPETRDLSVAVAGADAGDPAAVRRASERARFPERFDPLTTFPSDVWTSLGRKTHRNVVVNPPDWGVSGFEDAKVPPLRDAILRLWHPGMSAEPEWLVGRPWLPRPWWGWQAPRVPLGRLFRWPAEPGDLLDVGADFAAASTAPPAEGFQALASLAQAYGFSLVPHNWRGLRTYGLLSRPMRDALRNGGSFRLTALSPSVRDSLARWLHEDGTRTEGGRRVHPSEMFQPVLRDAVLQGEQSLTVQAIVMEKTPEGKAMRRTSAEALGAWIATDPTLVDRIEIHPDMRSIVKITASGAPAGVATLDMPVPILLAKSGPFRLSETPPAFQQAVERGRVRRGGG